MNPCRYDSEGGMKVDINPFCTEEVLLPRNYRWVKKGEIVLATDRFVFRDEWVVIDPESYSLDKPTLTSDEFIRLCLIK